MSLIDTLQKLLMLETRRDPREVERWVASLVPLLVAFVYFIMLMLPVTMANKDIIYIVAITAGFVGLQTYWILRGLHRNEGMTVLLGVIGIIIAAAAGWLYVYIFRYWIFVAA